mmetsp:Transcript_9382/g.21850  ORF Transcript_9382/g.21850 Transcript_9382/m.21850 type:complete len:228 (+) Transcript_9382:519-1202(+)
MLVRGMLVLALRSHSLSCPDPLPVIMCSPCVGFHDMSATPPPAPDSARSSHHGFLCRMSQTTTAPELDDEARMCGTWLFQAAWVTSPAMHAAASDSPGDTTEGADGDVRSTSRTAPEDVPAARRWDEQPCGLKPIDVTPPPAPPTRFTVDRSASSDEFPSSSPDGRQRFTVPSSIPPATTVPSRDGPAPPHAMQPKRPGVLTEPRRDGDAPSGPRVMFRSYSSSSPP